MSEKHEEVVYLWPDGIWVLQEDFRTNDYSWRSDDFEKITILIPGAVNVFDYLEGYMDCYTSVTHYETGE